MSHSPQGDLESCILRLNWSGKDDQVAYEWQIVGSAPKTPAEARKHLQVSDAMMICPSHTLDILLDIVNDDLIVVFVSLQR